MNWKINYIDNCMSHEWKEIHTSEDSSVQITLYCYKTEWVDSLNHGYTYLVLRYTDWVEFRTNNLHKALDFVKKLKIN